MVVMWFPKASHVGSEWSVQLAFAFLQGSEVLTSSVCSGSTATVGPAEGWEGREGRRAMVAGGGKEGKGKRRWEGLGQGGKRKRKETLQVSVFHNITKIPRKPEGATGRSSN